MQPQPHHLIRILLAFVACAASETYLLGQTTCHGLGGTPVAAAWQASPFVLGCAGAPSWPAWHLFTPAHAAPAPHPGFNPGDARARARLIITYQCTGFLLVPVVPLHIRTMGFVIDQAEIACTPPTTS